MDKGITSITVRTCLLIFLSGKGVLRLRSSSPNDVEADITDRTTKRQKVVGNNPYLDLEAVAEDEEDLEEEDEEENDQFIDDGMYFLFVHRHITHPLCRRQCQIFFASPE